MTCNCLCCGCRNCVNGELGKCCCSGTCCQANETCCSGVCCPPGESCVDGVCTPDEILGACCVDGVCTETTEAGCEGIWQGAYTTCEDGSCYDRCCVPQGACGSDAYYNCLEGYFADKCVTLGGTPSEGCDTTQVHPGTGNPYCADGGPTSVTVSVSGATATSASFQSVADAVNSSFVLDLTCNLAATEYLVDQVSVTVGGVTTTWYIYVTLSINTTNGVVTASVIVNSANPPALPPNGFGSAGTNSGTVMTSSYTNCAGLVVYDCTTYQLAAGLTAYSSSGGVVDFSGASIEVA